jgi:hypothetical protein
MGKLFKLREWLTLDEAAAHISNVLGESATVADLYRFALDGYLTLSVDFVNHASARKGKWLKTEQVEFKPIENDLFSGEKLDIPFSMPANCEVRVSEDDWIFLEKPVVSINGVWDLPMVGAEQLDIEHNYQQLTSGLEVTLTTLDGVFVQQGDVVCQLQANFDNNEYQKGSKAQQKVMERFFSTNDVAEDEANELRAKYKEDREDYLKSRKNKPIEDNYYPAGGLGEQDFVLVIRTEEVTRFIQSLEDTSVLDKTLNSKERNSLLVLIGALCKEVNIDPNKRGVAPALVEMTEILGAPLTDDTIRKILKQIEEAVALRNK